MTQSGPPTGLLTVLVRLRQCLLDSPLRLAAADAAEGSRERSSMLAQLDDYVIPRLVQVEAPLLAVVGWLASGPRPRVTGHTVGWSMAWPVGWIGYALALGALTDWYPYPFMDVVEIGYPTALRNLAFVAVLAIVLLLLFRLVDRRLPATEVSQVRR